MDLALLSRTLRVYYDPVPLPRRVRLLIDIRLFVEPVNL